MDSGIFWDARAQYYKDYNEINTLPPTLTLANMLNIHRAEHILEVACASGLFTVFCLSILEKAKTLISVDISNVMIELAEERKREKKGINNKIKHHFKVGDATDLCFVENASMDIYISSMCIHMISDQEKFLEEARRVLKKGGKMGLTIPSKEDGMVELFLKNLGRVGCAPHFPKDPWSNGYKDKMVELLQENGFRVEYCWQDHFKLPYYNDEDIDFQLNFGDVKEFFAPLSPEKKIRFRENVLKDFANMKNKKAD